MSHWEDSWEEIEEGLDVEDEPDFFDDDELGIDPAEEELEEESDIERDRR